MEKKRAVSSEIQKEKIQLIINTTENLFKIKEFEEITVSEIAKECKIAKGTFFNYFETKEEVFLTLTEQKMSLWSKNLSDKLKENSYKKIKVKEFVDIIVDSINDEVFMKLISILDDTLEKNISFERAVSYKENLKNEMMCLGESVEKVLGVSYNGEGMFILNMLFSIFVGVYKISNPCKTVKKVIQQPGLEIFNRDFIKSLKETAVYSLVGYFVCNRII